MGKMNSVSSKNMKNKTTQQYMESRSGRQLPEVLAPAGSVESFRGALLAGADAVYLGGRKYGARAYAENFDTGQIIECIRLAHILERKVYLTVNVATKDSELEDTVSYVKNLYENGLDGVIVQDLGVIARLRQECPALLLHASTQLSVTGEESVRLLKELGVCRVVPARELSLMEMKQIKEREPIEIEAFVHGAMCYSYSGRCLMSSFLGGRSGNRGRCAGTCRLPFSPSDREGNIIGKDVKRALRGECYPLSMKDLCVLEILPDLIDAGIDSFKIEGRMKRPEYAAGTTAFYRKYVDRFAQWDAAGRKTPWEIDAQDRRDLYSLYIRSELSTGYYYRRNGRDMVTISAPGYAGADTALLNAIKDKYLLPAPQRPVRGLASLYPGRPAKLTLMADALQEGEKEISVTVTGECVQTAQKRPMAKEDLEGRLSKLGDTPFCAVQMQVDAGDNIFMPVAHLNALRREAVISLEEEILRENEERRLQPADQYENFSEERSRAADAYAGDDDTVISEKEKILWACVLTGEQFEAAVRSKAAKIVIEDLDLLRNKRMQQTDAAGRDFYLALPHVFRSDARAKIVNTLQSEEAGLYKGVLARTLEEVELLHEIGYSGEIISDSSVYTWNRVSSDVILNRADRSVLSLELSAPEMEPLLSRSNHRRILSVYGRIPMMVSANCIRKTQTKCIHEEKDEDLLFLEDRKQARFPVRCVCGYCYNVMYNCVPLSLHKFVDHPVMKMCPEVMLSFTTESGEETARILDGYAEAYAGQSFDHSIIAQFTKGHFIKSVM